MSLKSQLGFMQKRGFECQCFRKKYVVLEVHMCMKIGFKFLEALHERAISGSAPGGRFKVAGECADAVKIFDRVVVFGLHAFD